MKRIYTLIGLIFVVWLIFTSCTKEHAPDCYVCTWTDTSHHMETKCGEKPANYFTDSSGNIIPVVCKKK